VLFRSTRWQREIRQFLPDVPGIEFELVNRPDQPPMGVGEAASTPVPAALANAVFDATGVRLRTVPFRPDRVRPQWMRRGGSPRETLVRRCV